MPLEPRREPLVLRVLLAELAHGADDLADGVIDFLLRVEPAEAEADRGERELVGNADRHLDVRRLDRGGRAGGARGDGHVPDACEQRFSLDVSEREVEIARQAPFVGLEIAVRVDRRKRVAVQVNFVESRRDSLEELVPKAAQAGRFRRELVLRELAGSREADDPRDVQRAGAKAVLMPPP